MGLLGGEGVSSGCFVIVGVAAMRCFDRASCASLSSKYLGGYCPSYLPKYTCALPPLPFFFPRTSYNCYQGEARFDKADLQTILGLCGFSAVFIYLFVRCLAVMSLPVVHVLHRLNYHSEFRSWDHTISLKPIRPWIIQARSAKYSTICTVLCSSLDAALGVKS